MAAPPQTWVEWADFCSKSVIAIAALAVTVGTSFITLAETRRANSEKEAADRHVVQHDERTDVRADETARRETTDFLLRYVPEAERGALQLKVAAAFCNDPAVAGTKSGANAALCKGVAELGSRRLAATASSANAAAQSAVTRQDPRLFLNSAAATAQNNALAAAEAARPAQSGRWFAVIGTLPQSDTQAVHHLAEQLNARLASMGSTAAEVHVYRTQISRSFALTSGTDMTAPEAQARARALRAAGFSDAFAQPDRGWVPADELR